MIGQRRLWRSRLPSPPRVVVLRRSGDVGEVMVDGIHVRSPNRLRGITPGARMAAAAATRHERETAHAAVLACLPPGASTWRGWVVEITRGGPRAMDWDNLVAALKAVIDGIADALGTHDRDARISWVMPRQRTDSRHRLIIRIERRGA